MTSAKVLSANPAYKEPESWSRLVFGDSISIEIQKLYVDSCLTLVYFIPRSSDVCELDGEEQVPRPNCG